MQPAERAESGPRSKQEVYQIIADEVLAGVLPPGTALPERALVKRFGISRTPIREVMWQLERDGLITIHSNRGAFVKRLGVEEVVELFQIRVALEPMACALAAARRPDGELKAISDSFKAVEEAGSPASPKDLTQLGEHMHDAIVRWSGNRMLVKIYDSLRMQSRLMRNLLHDAHNTETVSFAEHKNILEAIATRNSTLARQYMAEHLVRAQNAIMTEMFSPNLGNPVGT